MFCKYSANFYAKNVCKNATKHLQNIFANVLASSTPVAVLHKGAPGQMTWLNSFRPGWRHGFRLAD